MCLDLLWSSSQQQKWQCAHFDLVDTPIYQPWRREKTAWKEQNNFFLSNCVIHQQSSVVGHLYSHLLRDRLECACMVASLPAAHIFNHLILKRKCVYANTHSSTTGTTLGQKSRKNCVGAFLPFNNSPRCCSNTKETAQKQYYYNVMSKCTFFHSLPARDN